MDRSLFVMDRSLFVGERSLFGCNRSQCEVINNRLITLGRPATNVYMPIVFKRYQEIEANLTTLLAHESANETLKRLLHYGKTVFTINVT
jgi:hypothetical protein